MIAFPSNKDESLDPSELDLEHNKADIAMVRGLARRGLLSVESMQALAERLEDVGKHGEEERIRVAADKALVTMQVALLKILHDSARGEGGNSASVTNQQINIYLPSNGRELTNGGNGKH